MVTTSQGSPSDHMVDISWPGACWIPSGHYPTFWGIRVATVGSFPRACLSGFFPMPTELKGVYPELARSMHIHATQNCSISYCAQSSFEWLVSHQVVPRNTISILHRSRVFKVDRPQTTFSKVFWIGLAACNPDLASVWHLEYKSRLTSMNFSKSLSKFAKSSFRFLLSAIRPCFFFRSPCRCSSRARRTACSWSMRAMVSASSFASESSGCSIRNCSTGIKGSWRYLCLGL